MISDKTNAHKQCHVCGQETGDKYRKIISELPRNVIPKVYGDLLNGEWPVELGTKPEISDDGLWGERGLWLELCDYAEKRCNRKSRERYYIVHKLGFTEQEFEDIWDNGMSKSLRRLEEKIDKFLDQNKEYTTTDGNPKCNPIFLALICFIDGFCLGLLLHFILGLH